MKKLNFFLIILFTLLLQQSHARLTFAQFLDSLQALPESERTQAETNYLAQQEHIPIIEDTLCQVLKHLAKLRLFRPMWKRTFARDFRIPVG